MRQINTGLRYPKIVRKVLEEDVKVGWPPDDLLSLLALAQHYGCPTRLLDWSSEGLIAAWFAATEPSGLRSAADRIIHRRE